MGSYMCLPLNRLYESVTASNTGFVKISRRIDLNYALILIGPEKRDPTIMNRYNYGTIYLSKNENRRFLLEI